MKISKIFYNDNVRLISFRGKNKGINNQQDAGTLPNYVPASSSYGKVLVSNNLNFIKEQEANNEYFKLPPGCKPDEFQMESGYAISNNHDLLAIAPTGTGKTAIAQYAMSRNLKEGKKTFYTTPLKALSNQKLNEFRKIYGEENVGILTGDRRENTSAPILIMTTEVYRNMALADTFEKPNPIMENLGSVIFDELHYIGDKERGPVWEESIMFNGDINSSNPARAQVIALSATIGNYKELKEWMSEIGYKDIDLVVLPSEKRHVPLEFNSFFTASYNEEEKRIKKQIEKKGYVKENTESNKISKPSLSDFKHLVKELQQQEKLPVILFIFSRKFSRELLEYMEQEGEDLTSSDEKKEIEKIIDKYRSVKYIGSDLNIEALKKGYAVHNAGIIPAQKEMIEELFQKKLLKVVISTETLAAGINMPAKTVVISSPYKPDDNKEEDNVRLLTANEFKQMAGRAGRRGIDDIGYVYTMPVDKHTEQEFLSMEAMDSNDLESHYTPQYSFLSSFYEWSDDRSKLNDLFSKTFYVKACGQEDSEKHLKELEDISDKKINILVKRGFLQVDSNGRISPSITGKMASKVKGYDTISLTEMISEKQFKGITPESLAMIAGVMANPAKPRENEIVYNADLSELFKETQDNAETLYRILTDSVDSKLRKLYKKISDFGSYQEMLDFVQSLPKPEESEAELKAMLVQMQEIRNIIYKITKIKAKFLPEDVARDIKNGEIVPTRVLEECLKEVENYKKRIKTGSIDAYIERQQAEVSSLDTEKKGNKARARIERLKKELEKDLNYAKTMKFLDENLVQVLNSNYEFIKRNPPKVVKQKCDDIESMYIRQALKDTLIEEIKGLMSLEESEYKRINSGDINIDKNCPMVASFMNSLIRKNMEVSSQEKREGLPESAGKYSINTAKILYNWAYLNKISQASMQNWIQLLRYLPKEENDEGSVYRKILQTIDLLNQICEIAHTGADASDSDEDKKYYAELEKTAKEAKKLILKNPIEV